MGLLGEDWESQPPKVKIGKWATAREFDVPKQITPMTMVRLCGEQTSAKPEYRDREGCTRRMVFIDHDNGNMERQYENSFDSFMKDVQRCRVEKGKAYTVQRKKENGKYIWDWVLIA